MYIVQWFHYERCTLSEFYPADLVSSELPSNFLIFAFYGVAVIVLLQVVPRLIDVTQSASRPDLRQYFLQQLASLISTIGLGMKPYMAKLFTLIGEAWNEDASMKLTVINVMQQVGAAFGASFAPYVAELCPYLLKVFYADRTVDRSLTCAVTFLFFFALVDACHMLLGTGL
uniref:Uncharacterized protein n=1 Tax=Parascaris equorum TaxID=6256 RepID=A0A914RJJ3_PAREQ